MRGCAAGISRTSPALAAETRSLGSAARRLAGLFWIEAEEEQMSRKPREADPRAMLAVGVCFMGAGVALSLALRKSGSAPGGIGLIGLGLVFFAIGAGARRKAELGKSRGDEDDRSPS